MDHLRVEDVTLTFFVNAWIGLYAHADVGCSTDQAIYLKGYFDSAPSTAWYHDVADWSNQNPGNWRID